MCVCVCARMGVGVRMCASVRARKAMMRTRIMIFLLQGKIGLKQLKLYEKRSLQCQHFKNIQPRKTKKTINTCPNKTIDIFGFEVRGVGLHCYVRIQSVGLFECALALIGPS